MPATARLTLAALALAVLALVTPLAQHQLSRATTAATAPAASALTVHPLCANCIQ